jgi:hypothetical protein
MIRFELLRDAGMLVVEPKSALSAEDFREISRRIDLHPRDGCKPNALGGETVLSTTALGMQCHRITSGAYRCGS